MQSLGEALQRGVIGVAESSATNSSPPWRAIKSSERRVARIAAPQS